MLGSFCWCWVGPAGFKQQGQRRGGHVGGFQHSFKCWGLHPAAWVIPIAGVGGGGGVVVGQNTGAAVQAEGAERKRADGFNFCEQQLQPWRLVLVAWGAKVSSWSG